MNRGSAGCPKEEDRLKRPAALAMLCRSRTHHLPPHLRIIVVGDLDRARELYCDELGLPALHQLEQGLLLGAGKPPVPALTLCPAAALDVARSRRLILALIAGQGGSWVQLATTDLEATLARLRARGAPIVQRARRCPDGAVAGVALDPWENTLRLVQRDPGSAPPLRQDAA